MNQLPAEIAAAFTLQGKVAVITGAASGIGQESARVMALAGAKVIAADIDGDRLEVTCRTIRAAGGQAVSRQVDVASKADVEALADAAIAEAGQLEIWVNCAGMAPLHPLLETQPEVAERTIAVNMLGSYWGCMAAGRIMRERGGGSIINISSAGGAKPLPNMAIYGMTKAAVNSLTWTAAKELGPLGVRVNAVAPGWIVTPAIDVLCRDASGQIDAAKRAKVFADIAAQSPLGRIGRVSDVAYALVYLASDAASFVTGQVLRVNGGESM
jgi:3-oxoacyl-[acyl-carrier protein] reductase